jgi:Na+-translocating ferredoxin:NAD+ oxidoreductase subunit G
MSRKESSFLNMVISLFIVTLIASSALAFIYEITKEPIAASKLLKKVNAITKVVPEFDNDPASDVVKLAFDYDTLYFYLARSGEEVTGIAVETFTKTGFSGLIKLIVGFLPDGTINDIAVLEHLETPGLGDKMEKEKSFDKTTGLSWSSQFKGKNPGNFSLKVKQDNGGVDAITAATISSRAYCDAVRRAYEGFLVMSGDLAIDSIQGETETTNSE